MTILDSTFVGVDANKDIIEASIRPTGELWRVGGGENGMTEITDRLAGISPELVVLQANGSFELPLAGILATAGLPFAFVQPRLVRDFARAVGRVGRTGHGQAGLLAHFAELVRPEASPLSDDLIQQLRDLRVRRHEVLEMIALERTRAETAPPIIQKDVQNHIHCLERSMIGIDELFSRTIRISRIWR